MSTDSPGSWYLASPTARCQFCSAQYASDLAYCPRCGLARGADLTASPTEPSQSPYGAPVQSPYGAPVQSPYGAPVQSMYELPGGVDPPVRSLRRYVGWLAGALVVAALIAGGAAYVGSQPSRAETAVAHLRVPDGPGVVYRSARAHFAARFPDAPEQHVIPASIGGLSLSIVVVVDALANVAVECEQISQPLPPGEISSALSSFINSSASGGTVITDSETTFDGYQAHQGSIRRTDGELYSEMIVVYSGTRLYALLAPTGATYDALLASFVPAP
jgi:hypothetical protein